MNAVVTTNERQLPEPVSATSSPMEMIGRALERGATVEQIQQFMDLQERFEEKQARREFNQAFAAFKAEAIVIAKGTTIKDGPLKGKKHANLFDVVDAVTPKLSAHGMAISWRLTKDEKEWMEVTCTLRHVAGHSEQVSMGSAPDSGPGRNAIQARGSAKSYLERYTATAILGLAAKDQDDDGIGTSAADTITEKQAADLHSLAEEVGADPQRFLKYMGVSRCADIKASDFQKAVNGLRQKGRQS